MTNINEPEQNKIINSFIEKLDLNNSKRLISNDFFSIYDKSIWNYIENSTKIPWVNMENIKKLTFLDLKFILSNILYINNYLISKIPELEVNVYSIKFAEKTKKVRNKFFQATVIIKKYLISSKLYNLKQLSAIQKEKWTQAFIEWWFKELELNNIKIDIVKEKQIKREMKISLNSNQFKILNNI